MAKNPTISLSFVVASGPNGLQKLTVDANELKKAMGEVVKISQQFEKKAINYAAVCTGVNAMRDSFSQLNSTVQSLTAESQTFDKAMRAANTMAGKDAAGFAQMKDQVAALAREIPLARDLLANGLYQAISNGVPEDNWLDFLRTSARSATGGMADLEKVVGVTSTVIKNYGLDWQNAAEIQDKIQLTAKNGVTSFEQLAAALPRVTGNAATLGVSIDELMGTFATLTGVSGNTAEVSTQLAAIFTSLVKPSSEAGKMAAEMGIQFDAAAIKAAGGFQNFLTQLDSSVKAYAQSSGALEQEVYGRLFGSAEALRALIPLQGELADKFASNVAAMADSAGTMDAAFSEMSGSAESKLQLMQNKWAELTGSLTSLLAGLAPYLNFFDKFFSSGLSIFILIRGGQDFAIKAKLASAAMTALGLHGRSAAAVVRVFSAALKEGAFSATALKIALRGLLMATGVGAAIWGLVSLFDLLAGSANSAAEATEKVAKAGKGLNFKTPSAIISEGYDTTEVRKGESYEDRIARLKEAWKENVARIKEIKALQRAGKITTEKQGQAALAEMRSLANQNKRIKEAIKQAKKKQKKEEGVVVTATKQPKKIPQPQPAAKPTAPKGSIAELEKQISDIRSKIQLEVDADSRAALYRELNLLEEQKQRIEFTYKFPDFRPTELPAAPVSVPLKVETDITKYKPELENVSDWTEGLGEKAKDMSTTAGEAFKQLGGSISSLGNALELPELNVAGVMAQAIATMVLSYSEAMHGATLAGPLGWLVFGATGLAQLAAIVSSVKEMPKFAAGGIISGPTIGLMGEYPGAANNPEVVAPLSELHKMLRPAAAPAIVGGTFRVSGRDLVCVLGNETNIASKSGRRAVLK